MAYTTYDLDDLMRRMEARWDGVPFWTNEEARSSINEALKMWNMLTGFWKRRVEVLTTSGETEYPLPTSMVFGIRVEYNGRTLDQTSLAEMDEGRPSWQSQLGNPKLWMPVDLDTIRVWPIPDQTDQILTIDGVAATPQLIADGDTVDIGSEALTAILGYTLHIAALKEGGERFKATMPYLTNFLSAANEENDQLEKSEMFRHFMGIDPKAEPTR